MGTTKMVFGGTKWRG